MFRDGTPSRRTLTRTTHTTSNIPPPHPLNRFGLSLWHTGVASPMSTHTPPY